MKTSLSFFFLLCLCLGLASCSDSGSEQDPAETFDRELMLSSITNSFILPNVADLKRNVDFMVEAVDVFVQEPSNFNLNTARNRWDDAFMQWQQVNSLNFGPGDRSLGTIEVLLGTFPVNTAQIEANVLDPNFDLNSSFDLSIRGFLAMEYLLFGTGDTATIVNQFLNSSARGAYLQTLSRDISEIADEVREEWNSFAETFISQTGTDVGSSTTILFNNLASGYESLKNFKVGLPAGKRPGQAQTEPEQVEAFYSGQSIRAIQFHFDGIKSIWRGGIGRNAIGFDDYLNSVEGGAELVASTEAQFDAVDSAITEVLISGLTLSELIEQDFTKVENLHTELQQLTRFLKSDMASLLGLSITFNSGDGD